ncbi:universal stress protein [Ascidiimonas aurantiaca]|uniref:universal stress protein n=1 Tax=Ascidiimonas aurantiaca TaxID=1685432 RepID=UPI0030EF26B9
MKRILVPTDFSNFAENALKAAAQLARRFDAELYLMHSLELPFHLANAEKNDIPEAIFFMKLARQKFEEFKSKPYLKDLKVIETVEDSSTYDAVNSAVSKNEIDLVVMGSGGASGFKEFVIGSTTEKVVRHAKVPVLVIKKDMNDFKVDNFVFACDFTPESFESLLKGVAFAKLFDAHIHFLYVNTPGSFATTQAITDRIHTFMEKVDPGPHTIHIYNDFSVEKGILNFSASTNADLIGLSTHGRKGLAHIFNGSITEDFTNHSQRPVITFKMT